MRGSGGGGGGGVGGGGVQVSLTKKKKALTMLFFSPLIVQKSNGQFQRNLSFLGVQHFPGVGGGGGFKSV